MAQSKKHLLKTVRRRCKKVGRALAFTSYRHGDRALLATYGKLRLDILTTMQTLRQAPSADLRDVTPPVTFQQVDQLRQRVATLHQSVSTFVTIL